mmetsp:Transcript_12722/g.19132  ORF Transcript_12722/g.19132 Transcript_12722/m.19132 type:complete len:150 (-) Transcript_12722:181-630(-)
MRTHNGGLFCQEGSTHVGRASVRVHHPPGGSSSYNILTHQNESGNQEVIMKQPQQENMESPYKQNNSGSGFFNMKQKQQQEITGKVGESPMKQNPILQGEESEQIPLQEKKNTNGGASLYCNEGGCIRNRPSVKVRGHQQRSYNIISGS